MQRYDLYHPKDLINGPLVKAGDGRYYLVTEVDAEIERMKERIKELIAAYNEYAEVLVAEIDDLNGFRSSGTEAGKKARDRINKAEQAMKGR